AITTLIQQVGGGGIEAVQWPTGQRTSATYDGNGNTLTVTKPNGDRYTMIWESLGRLQSLTDPSNARWSLSYVAALSDRTRPLEPLTDPIGMRLTLAYGSGLRRYQDATSAVSTFLWDTNNNRTAMIDPLGSRTSTMYESHGLPSAVIDATGA